MSRTSSTAVESIIDGTPEKTLTPFIDAANLMVTNLCSADTDYSANDLEMIERYLAAHFYQITIVPADSADTGNASESKRSKIDMGLNLTHFGQMAMRFDYNHHLMDNEISLQKGLSAAAISLTWLGSTEDELLTEE